MAISIIFFMPKREIPEYKTSAAGDNLKGIYFYNYISDLRKLIPSLTYPL